MKNNLGWVEKSARQKESVSFNGNPNPSEMPTGLSVWDRDTITDYLPECDVEDSSPRKKWKILQQRRAFTIVNYCPV